MTKSQFPSITCSKCSKKSYNANDIKHRFCPDCGYHALASQELGLFKEKLKEYIND